MSTGDEKVFAMGQPPVMDLATFELLKATAFTVLRRVMVDIIDADHDAPVSQGQEDELIEMGALEMVNALNERLHIRVATV